MATKGAPVEEVLLVVSVANITSAKNPAKVGDVWHRLSVRDLDGVERSWVVSAVGSVYGDRVTPHILFEDKPYGWSCWLLATDGQRRMYHGPYVVKSIRGSEAYLEVYIPPSEPSKRGRPPLADPMERRYLSLRKSEWAYLDGLGEKVDETIRLYIAARMERE